jgi:hypothetical protein
MPLQFQDIAARAAHIRVDVTKFSRKRYSRISEVTVSHFNTFSAVI